MRRIEEHCYAAVYVWVPVWRPDLGNDELSFRVKNAELVKIARQRGNVSFAIQFA